MGKPGTFPCLFGGEPSPLPASSRWQAWFGGSSWLSPISPMQRQGKPMRSMPRGSRQPSGGWVFWPFRRQAKRARHVFRKLLKGVYSKEINTQKSLTEIPDIKIDNVGKCWEINGVPVGVFCRLTIQGILWALQRSWKVQGKTLKNSSIHLYAPPVTTISMEGPSFRRWGTKKSVCSSPWTPKEAHAQGRSGLTTECLATSGDIFSNRTLSPIFVNVLSAQCFGPSSCPFIIIYPYIYMIIPRPSKQLCIGSFIPSSKSVPKVLWKKNGGSRCPLRFV